MQSRQKIIVVVGPTASGKSAVAEFLATQFPAVIINADARQIYQGLQVLTAAPPPAENKKLYEFKEVDESYSFAQYIIDADQEIAAAAALGRMPIVVGGSGLYVDALSNRLAAPPQIDLSIREQIKKLSNEAALAELLCLQPKAGKTIELKNPRRVARALEVWLQTGRPISDWQNNPEPIYDALLVGVAVERAVLLERIDQRTKQMWAGGAISEVETKLATGHKLNEPGMKTIGVPEIAKFLRGELTAVEAQELMTIHTRQYAKRQMTWFKRNPQLVWYNSIQEICLAAQLFLHKNFKN